MIRFPTIEDADVEAVIALWRAENDHIRGFYEKLGYETDPVLYMGRRITGEGE